MLFALVRLRKRSVQFGMTRAFLTSVKSLRHEVRVVRGCSNDELRLDSLLPKQRLAMTNDYSNGAMYTVCTKNSHLTRVYNVDTNIAT